MQMLRVGIFLKEDAIIDGRGFWGGRPGCLALSGKAGKAGMTGDVCRGSLCVPTIFLPDDESAAAGGRC